MSEQNKPLLSDEHLIATDDRVRRATLSNLDSLKMVRDHYEAQRSKDRELIQTLVGELVQSRASILGWIPDELTPMAHQMKIALKRINSALALAGEQGYQPTEG